MTQSDNERLAMVLTQVSEMRQDIGEIKDTLRSVVQRGDSRHEKLAEQAAARDARIAVLESNVQKLERLLWASGGVGVSAVAGHVPALLTAIGG